MLIKGSTEKSAFWVGTTSEAFFFLGTLPPTTTKKTRDDDRNANQKKKKDSGPGLVHGNRSTQKREGSGGSFRIPNHHLSRMGSH